MSKKNTEPFLAILRDFLEDPDWIEADPIHCKIFITILSRCVWTETKHNDHGQQIILKPGQVCVSIRKLAQWTGPGVTRHHVTGCLKYFFEKGKLRQEVGHCKTILTVSDTVIYINKNKESRTRSQTTLGQKIRNTDKNLDDDEGSRPKKGKLSFEKIEVLKNCIEICTQEKIDLNESVIKRLLSSHDTETFRKCFNDTLKERRKTPGKQRSFAAILTGKLNGEKIYGET